MIIRAEQRPYALSVGLYFVADDKSGIVKPILMEMETKNQHGFHLPSLEITLEDAQQLINELWRVGMRPHNGEGTSAQVDALKYHLEDMRKLVFDERK